MVLWRKRRGGTIEVLMGRRHRNHVFMPHAYVFPGGRVDAIDAKLNPTSPLPADVQARLERAANPTRARAIAAGAVRETFEETGLLLGDADSAARVGFVRRSKVWTISFGPSPRPAARAGSTHAFWWPKPKASPARSAPAMANCWT